MPESLPDDPSGQSPLIQAGVGNRNKCPVPGTLYNTNTLESFHSLDRAALLKMEGKKIFDDIISGKADEDSAVLSRFLIISFADLKKWTFRYWFAFPAMSLDPPATLINIQPAANVFSSKEAKSLSTACNEWRNSNLTAGVPFFLVYIASNAHVTVRPLKNFEASHCDGEKLLFGFYDPCNLTSNPGWPLHFLCYREKRGMADMEFSLVGEAVVMLPQGWRDPRFVPKAVGWDLKPMIINLAVSMDPERLAESAADLNLKLMRLQTLPSLNIKCPIVCEVSAPGSWYTRVPSCSHANGLGC